MRQTQTQTRSSCRSSSDRVGASLPARRPSAGSGKPGRRQAALGRGAVATVGAAITSALVAATAGEARAAVTDVALPFTQRSGQRRRLRDQQQASRPTAVRASQSGARRPELVDLTQRVPHLAQPTLADRTGGTVPTASPRSFDGPGAALRPRVAGSSPAGGAAGNAAVAAVDRTSRDRDRTRVSQERPEEARPVHQGVVQARPSAEGLFTERTAQACRQRARAASGVSGARRAGAWP
jgi:hypothetical protein